jgi:hypothetical protein
MLRKSETVSKKTNPGTWIRLIVIAAGLGLGVILGSCTGTTIGGTTPAADGAVVSGGSTIPGGDHPAATPTVEAQGVYPAPESASAAGTAVPKAYTPGAGTNSVFLPAIINEKPPVYPFEIQPTGVIAVQGFSGCNWIGVAGQVFDLTGAPLKNLVLHLEGLWNSAAVSREALSGSTDLYGPAGYEFVLGTQPLDSIQALWIQVLDGSHKAISARIYLDTYNDCARNLILVNFVQVR